MKSRLWRGDSLRCDDLAYQQVQRELAPAVCLTAPFPSPLVERAGGRELAQVSDLAVFDLADGCSIKLLSGTVDLANEMPLRCLEALHRPEAGDFPA